MNFLRQLKQRNALLYWFGWFNILVGLACLAGILVDDRQLLGVNRWLKPMKFYFSVGIMVLTMGWLLYYLNNKKKIRRYSRVIAFTMFFENGLILLQAFRGTTSHFNIKTAIDIIIFDLMGVFILIFIVAVILICIDFFRQRQFNIPAGYVWGIRLGILFFIIFSLEGGIMLGLLKHTVGADDGTPGLPVLNWSRQYGDLRIAHFLGIHALQLLPLAGYYLIKSKRKMIVTAAIYFAVVMFVFIQSLQGIPLIP
ncbi:MAG TPA: hypothetical protein VFD56_13540 [Chitinophagaceae bacterium]|nr:hypothetical protein [Chitinophagaceae bacterium]